MSQGTLATRHHNEVGSLPYRLQQRIGGYWAVTYRPGDNTGTFHGKPFRTLGDTVLVTQYVGPPQRRENARPVLFLSGFTARFNPATGCVQWDTHGRVFDYNFYCRPAAGAKGRVLDHERNPSLVQLGLDMFKARRRFAEKAWTAPTVPQLPPVWLGFPEKSPPPMEDSPRLRLRVADRLNRDVAYVDRLPEDDRRRLLEDEWRQTFIRPGERENNTGHLLAPFQLCSRARDAVRIYEGSAGLLGREVTNIVRAAATDQIANPARAVFADLDLPAEPTADDKDAWPVALVERIEKAMCRAIGPKSILLSREAILGAIDNPNAPIVPDRAPEADDYARLFYHELLPAHQRECCSLEDIDRAIASPGSPLRLSGAATIQVLGRPDNWSPEFLTFGGQELRHDRLTAELLPPRHQEFVSA